MKKLFRRKKKKDSTDEETTVTDQQAPTDEDDVTATNYDYDEELMDEENESDNEEEDMEQKQLLYHQYSDYTSEDLKSSLDEIIDSIDAEYRVEDFSYIDAIARSLKNGTDKEDLRKLKDNKKFLDDAVKQIVCVNYKGFNKSIRNFSDMLDLMEKGQSQVQNMIEKVRTTKELLALRSTDLISLYSSYLQQKEILDILDVVQKVKNAPNEITSSMNSKHFLYAARTLKTYNGMANSERLRSIKALHDIRDQFMEFYDKMPDIITDELKAQLHIHAYQKSLDMIDDDDWRYQLAGGSGSGIPTHANSPITIPKLNSKLANQIKRFSTRPGVSPIITKEDPEPEQKIKPFSQVQDNLALDYEKEDPAQYVINLVEALDVLGTLSELQSKLVQNLRFELRHLIESHINEFANSLKGSDRDLLWLIIQNKNLASNEQVGLFSSNFDDPLEQHKTNTGKAILQGRLISEMMEGLFIKLKKVMKNYQFLIKLLEQKLAQRDSSIIGDKELGSMSIILSKQVITRVRESISKKLEDLRLNFRTAGDFEDLLQECMEELMYNFIDKNYDESARQRVKDLILIFEVQVDLKTRDAGKKEKQNAEKVKSSFKTLVINTLSSPDTPSLLSIEHIWKTVEDEMGSVLKELLGLRNSDLDNSSKRKSTTNLSEFADNGKKKKKISDFNFEIKFKFSTNVDFPLMAMNESEDQGSMKILCESLNSYFIFSPYNIIWMYKVVTGFVDQIYSNFKIVNDRDEDDEDERTYSGNSNESILQMFMDNFIIGAFMPLIEEDYRNKLSKLLTDQDKHNTNAFLPRESPNQTSSTYTYVSKTEKRPLLNSALFLASWLRELFKISLSLPVYKMSIFNVIEIVLKNYLASCKSQFDSVIRGKFIQQSLTAEYESVYPVLKSDPNFKLLYTKSKSQIDSSTYSKLSEKFYKKLFVIIDEKLQINYPHNLPKTKFIDNNSQLILLANINDSLEWLADLIKSYQKELIQTELFAVKTQQKTEEYRVKKEAASTPNTTSMHQVASDPNIRKPIKVHHLRVLSTDAESVTSDHSDEETNAIQRIKKSTLFLSNYEKDYRDLAIRCLFSLKLDIRVHCYHFIHCNLMDNLLKFGTYDCEDERKEPEDFINLFNQDLFRIERYLSCYLPKSKLRYLFESIEKMILDLFIGSLPFAISQFYEMKLDDSSSAMLGGGDLIKSPSFSKLGLEKMMRNIFSLQQQLSSFSFVDERKFESIREYFYLLQMQSHQLLRMIETKSLKQLPFTQDQYEAILQTDYDHIKRDVKDVNVCRQFFEKKIKKQQEALAAKSVNSPTTPTRRLVSSSLPKKK
ncbi:predicted protein [Naegleria gruberi]|uniref:Exocyst complex component Sec8 n=1 Tax=Naegleria gruberi TaxID=5762 RepID=D2W0M8_NAEGR|nr:uncharacterized protein NAEGRDRAFT_53762 [Naegleria gruberi]EFC37318.1 predicted protein [Naegleria gruberi]|eukprot:XP_002670062.1 predicted protein [Naegleria gruberi strain NEG-M]